jgi:hypothetical protein
MKDGVGDTRNAFQIFIRKPEEPGLLGRSRLRRKDGVWCRHSGRTDFRAELKVYFSLAVLIYNVLPYIL